MAKLKHQILAFNRGLVSRLALGRVDLKRMALSAETMVNWMPRVLGSMMLRAGQQYLGSSHSDAAARYLPFVFSVTDTALIEFTALIMRVWVSDALISRVSVSTAVANGTFDTNLTSWTDNDEAGGTSVWVAGGYMGLTGNGSAAAIRDQQVTVAAADQGDEHALRIVIQRGPVILRVGSTSGGDDYISETELATGAHSLAFTPTGNFHIRFLSRLKRQVLVDSCAVESSGTMTLPTPFAAGDLSKIRYDQSADVIFLACDGYTQRRIERRGTRSWSLVQYFANDGPFRTENLGPITLTPAALSGNTTLTASAALFKSTLAPSTNNAGALFYVTSNGQNVSASITAENQFTNAIRVTGVDTQRVFSVVIDEDAAGAATFTLQRSLESETGPWTDVQQWTADVTTTFDDNLDNQIAWYRLGVKTGDYVNGTHAVSLAYTVGSITGVCRVTSFVSSTVVNVEVIEDFGGTSATDIWAEGEWSDRRGWPSATALYEGRLMWAGEDRVWGSITDAYDGFNPDFEGDAGPISRTIGSGPVETINWLLPMQRLLMGTAGSEFSARSTAFDEPLTPTNCTIKETSTQGSAEVAAVKIDARGMFVQRGGTRLYELAFNFEISDYSLLDLTAIVPEIGEPSITRVAVQRQPDTRIHCVRSDGVVALCVFDRVENVLCWLEIETDGTIEDVVVLPGTTEDRVYYHVNRTINGSTKRYLEKVALESECRGGTLNKQADSFLSISQSSSTAITGLSHLEGETVVIWANGKDLGTKVVSGGQITGLSESVTTAIVGLPYTAQWKSIKLSGASEIGLLEHKRIPKLGVILADTHHEGLEYGPSFSVMDPLPEIEAGTSVTDNTVHTAYDEELFTFPGEWDTDARLCLQAEAPRPCTVLAAVIGLESHA